jgi:hypothetical protein
MLRVGGLQDRSEKQAATILSTVEIRRAIDEFAVAPRTN